MKTFANIGLLLGLALMTAACGTKVEYDDEMLVVEQNRVDFLMPQPDEVCVYMDIPVGGPEYLRDSIERFLNDQLFDLCDGLAPGLASSDELFDKYRRGYFGELSDVYSSAYAGAFQREDIGQLEASFRMISQTASFVTYGVETYYCGGGCGSKLATFTFRKDDGRQVDPVITEENLVRFLREHPHVDHPFYDWQLDADEAGTGSRDFFDVGLLEDGVLLVNEDWMNHYNVTRVDYEVVLPYLSEQARELVGGRGKTGYSYRDWNLGVDIGLIETGDGIVSLKELPPLWDSFNSFTNESGDPFFRQDRKYTLAAFVWDSGLVRDVKSGKPRLPVTEFEFPDAAWTGPKPLTSGDCFLFDRDVLFVPYEKEPCQLEYAPYKFNGKRFVRMRKEDDFSSFEELAVLKGEPLSDDIHLLRQGDLVKSFIVRDGIHIPVRVFPDNEGLSDRLFIPSCDSSDCLTSNPDGLFDCRFLPEEGLLYVPSYYRFGMGSYRCLDRYYVYRFNGSFFNFQGIQGGFWLHPSVREYGGLELLARTEDYLVRVDDMSLYNWNDEYELEETGKDLNHYRYVAWKHKDDMLDIPDLVIENGFLDDEGAFVFENEGYRYVVGEDLLVYKGGRLILRQEMDFLTWNQDD